VSARGYAAALRRLQGLGRLGVRFDLSRLAPALRRLGHPERRFRSVHLAGTNGKGSTAAMIAACLEEAGLRTGLYVSPHLSRFTERIRIDGAEIDRAEVPGLSRRVLSAGPELTFFEAVTVMALSHFAERGVEVAVVETGLGGRLDATNVVTPEVAVLTRIDLDHTDILGRELIEVAAEKAGIIKRGVPVVSAPPATAEVAALLERRSAELDAPLLLLGRDFQLRAGSFEGQAWSLRDLELGMAGGHQLENAALCLAALERLQGRGIAVTPEHARRGLAGVRWPGRMEWIDRRHLLDGAHNPCGARALARGLPDRRFVIVMGLLGSRSAAEFLRPLASRCARLVLTRPRSERAVPPEAMAREVVGMVREVEIAPDLRAALRSAGGEHPVLVTGSLYLVGEARELLLGEPGDPELTADPLP
jgi:dihydrofolate synthase/folylpolyglutamate synthase